MSVRVITWVWDHSVSSGTDRLVMLALADNADDRGACWPSMLTIARKARISERTARRSVRTLEELGELVSVRGGGMASNRYRINLDPRVALADPGHDDPAAIGTPGQNDPPGQIDPGVITDISARPAPVNMAAGSPVTEEPSIDKSSKRTKGAPASRGSRLPENWMRSPADIEWQHTEGIPDEFARVVTGEFKDYWLGAAGRNASKVNWSRAWRTWISREWRNNGPRWQRDRGTAPPKPGAPAQTADWMRGRRDAG